MDLKKAQEYIKALKNGEKFPKKNMFLIMFLLGALLFVIVLPTGSSAPTGGRWDRRSYRSADSCDQRLRKKAD